jgi:hypothetical protein
MVAPPHNQERKIMARGDMPTVMREASTPPEGIASAGMVLMVHALKGYRWIPGDERAGKERWGFEYVRDYMPGDELSALRLEEMTAEQLETKADALRGMAAKKKTKTEKKYEAKVEADKKDAEARDRRAGRLRR